MSGIITLAATWFGAKKIGEAFPETVSGSLQEAPLAVQAVASPLAVTMDGVIVAGQGVAIAGVAAKNVAVAAPGAIAGAAVATKDFVVDTAIATPGAIANAAVATKDFVVDTAVATPGAIVDSAVAVKDFTVETAIATKDLAVNGAIAAKDGVVAGATYAKDATVENYNTTGAIYESANGALETAITTVTTAPFVVAGETVHGLLKVIAFPVTAMMGM